MEFYIETTEGGRQYPRDFLGHWTLLFYYSGDFLPVSATELMGLAQHQGDFSEQGCDLLCVSKDSVAAHLAFLENLSRHRKTLITFPLGSKDLEGLLQLNPHQKYIWLLAPDGCPKAHFSYPLEIGVNFTEVLRTLLALKTGKSTPYGWVPEASTLALPPATRQEQQSFMKAQEQAGNICLDWYLCFEQEKRA